MDRIKRFFSLNSWGLRSETSSHIACLDGLRGVAILLVICAHGLYTNPNGGPLHRLFGGFFESGAIGVPIFFALSGFVIARPFLRSSFDNVAEGSARKYFNHRFFKIVPPFYLVLFVFTALFYWESSDLAYLKSAGLWAIGAHNFIRQPSQYIINGSFWSLIVEAQFYIVIFIIMRFLKGHSPRSTFWICLGLLYLIPTAVRIYTFPLEANPQNVFFLGQRFPCAFDYFAFGVAFAILQVSGWLPSKGYKFNMVLAYGRLASMVIGCLVLGAFRFFERDVYGSIITASSIRLLTQLAAFGLLASINLPGSLISIVLTAPVLRFIGLVSFEWFLIHQPMFFWARHHFGPAEQNIPLYFLIVGVPVAISFFIACIIYRFYSLPILLSRRQ